MLNSGSSVIFKPSSRTRLGIKHKSTMLNFYDFRMEILSYGDQIKVVEPEGLKSEIKKELKSCIGNYE